MIADATTQPQEQVVDSGILGSFAALLPWAVSIVFHIALLLVLMFFTILVIQNQSSDEPLADDFPPFVLPPGAGNPASADSADFDGPAGKKLLDAAGSPRVTKNLKNEAFGRGTDPKDFRVPQDEVKKAGTPDGAGLRTDFDFLSVVVNGAPGAQAGDGDGSRPGRKGDSPFGRIGNGLGDGGRFWGVGPGEGGDPHAMPVRKIVYVVDASGSMFETFSYVQAELKRAITSLRPIQQYTVIFFADGPATELQIGGQRGLVHATDAAKAETFKWVDRKIAKSDLGLTDCRPSLERAFKVPGGPPELIYLLTDGMFPRETLDTLKKLNPNHTVRITTFAFRDRVGEELLRQIAKENNGRYRYVSESEMGSD